MGLFITPTIVGRREELGQLENALSAVHGGVGRCVLLNGEAGIGKSRLLLQVRDRATDRACLTLVGRCFEQDTTFPYGPLIDMLRTYFVHRNIDDILASLGPQISGFAKLLPEIAAHVPKTQPAPFKSSLVRFFDS